MTVCIECLCPGHRFDQDRLKKTVCRVLRAEGYRNYDLTLVLTDSVHLRRLNRRFRHLDHVTDVISFAMLEGPGAEFTQADLGDIYISLPRARRQARDYQTTFESELRRLAIHGLLHLLGHDHIKPRPAAAMRRLEERYLED